MLKREFFRDEKIASLSLGARLLFQSLWCEADDTGNGRADARLLKSEAFPYDEFTANQVEEWLQEIVTLKMVRLYEVGGARYYGVVNFLRHQTIDRPSKFRHPAPPPLAEHSPKARRTLDEYSAMKEKGKEKEKGKGNEEKGYAAKPAAFVVPDWVPGKEWNDWIEMREGIRKKPSKGALEIAIKKLDGLRKQGHDPKLVLNNSTLNSWAGLFPPKKDADERSGSDDSSIPTVEDNRPPDWEQQQQRLREERARKETQKTVSVSAS